MPGPVGFRLPQSLLVRNQRRKGKVDYRLQESLEVKTPCWFWELSKKERRRGRITSHLFEFLCFFFYHFAATKLANTSTKVEANVRSVIAVSICTRYPTVPKRTSDRLRENCVGVVSAKTKTRYPQIKAIEYLDFSFIFFPKLNNQEKTNSFDLDFEKNLVWVLPNSFMGFSGGTREPGIRSSIGSRFGRHRSVQFGFGRLFLGRSR